MRFIKNDDLNNLKEVTSLNIISDKGKAFDKDGIFSPSIFGSADYSCECGHLSGAWHTGEICPKCNSTIINPKDNIYRNGRFVIPKGYKIINPMIYLILQKYIKNFEFRINPNNKHIDINGHIIYDLEDGTTLINYTDFTKNYKETIEKIVPDEIIYEDSNIDSDDDTNEDTEQVSISLKDFLINNEESVMLSSIPLLPIHLRPSNMSEKQMNIEPLNKCYVAINTHINSLKSNVEDDDLLAIERELFEIQKIYQELVDKILLLVSAKEGLCRDEILSSRICYSGRAVIALKNDNDPMSVNVPKIMFTEMYLPRIITLLTEYLGINHSKAYEYYYLNRFNYEDEYINKCVEDILLTKPRVLINRNPTLHLLSIQSFHIKKVTNDHVIRIPKTALQSLNADFDGDTAAVFTLSCEESKEESKVLSFRENLLSHKKIGINPHILPYQDNALGLYLMDSNNA